jgi:nitrogen regulatory protein PII
MVRPFICLCGSAQCLQYIAGARLLTLEMFDRYLINSHMREVARASVCTKNRDSDRGGRTVIPMKKVEAIFISSKLDTVRELLSGRCGLDLATSRVNQPHDRGQASLFADLPVVKLETVVSDTQAMPTVQAILRASRTAPGIDLVSIGISKVDSQAPRLRESLPPRRQSTESLRAA